LARFLAGKHKRGMRNPLGWIAGCSGAGRGGLADMGGSAAVEQRRRACSCREGGLRAKPSNATERGGGDVAHRGREVVGNVAQRVVGGGVERRVAAAFVGEDAAGVPRRLVFTGRAANLS
jgi:hypothetical protein